MSIKFKARLARLRGKSTVSVKPRFLVPTWSMFEEVCLLCGLDPDDVRKGKATFRDAALEDVHRDGRRMLDLTLSNAKDFDVECWEKHVAEDFVGVVIAHFFVYALTRFEEQRIELLTTLGAVESTNYPPRATVMRRSAVS